MFSLRFPLLPLTNTSSRSPPLFRRPLRSTAQNVVVEEDGRVAGGRAEELLPLLPAGLRRELMPEHVAVIMDGNRRWARMRRLPVWSGYVAGARALRALVELCCRWGIRVLTVFAFSSDNWFRPKVKLALYVTLIFVQLHICIHEVVHCYI